MTGYLMPDGRGFDAKRGIARGRKQWYCVEGRIVGMREIPRAIRRQFMRFRTIGQLMFG